jgi:hypothetical protein
VPTCSSGHFENDEVSRTNLPRCCLSVHQNRSTWLVSPSCLAHSPCLPSGSAARYAGQKSVRKTAPSRYARGSARNGSVAVRAERSPVTIATTARAGVQGRPGPDLVELSAEEAPHLVGLDHEVAPFWGSGSGSWGVPSRYGALTKHYSQERDRPVTRAMARFAIRSPNRHGTGSFRPSPSRRWPHWRSE